MGSAGYKVLVSHFRKLQFFSGPSYKTKPEMSSWHKLVWFTSAGAREIAAAHPTHRQSHVSHCSSLCKPDPPAPEPVSPGGGGQPASHIVLTGVHLLLQAYLPVWDEAPPPTAIWTIQARTTFHRRSQLLWTHHMSTRT